jgi:general secretion pathway protein G
MVRFAKTIVAVLVALVVVGLVAFLGAGGIHLEHSKPDQALLDVLAIESALKNHRQRTGQLPPPNEDQDLRALVPVELERRPRDPWDREYRYRWDDGGVPVVESLGADGEPGGDGDGADIRVRLDWDAGR